MSDLRAEAGSRSCARVIRLACVSPERELAVVASLAQRPGACALVIAELSGDAASLGRFQREGRSRAKLELRRFSSRGPESTPGSVSHACGEGASAQTETIPSP